MEAALDAGADDVQREDERFLISTSPAAIFTRSRQRSRQRVPSRKQSSRWCREHRTNRRRDAEALFKLIETIEDRRRPESLGRISTSCRGLAKVEG